MTSVPRLFFVNVRNYFTYFVINSSLLTGQLPDFRTFPLNKSLRDLCSVHL